MDDAVVKEKTKMELYNLFSEEMRKYVRRRIEQGGNLQAWPALRDMQEVLVALEKRVESDILEAQVGGLL